MNVLVDTSVWSLALRRNAAPTPPEVIILGECLDRGEAVLTGVVLQELLQGFHGPAQAARIIAELTLLPVIMPELEDHIEAAALRNHCRRHGLQVGTIDALIARLAIRHELPLLTADKDFTAMSRYCALQVLRA